MNVLTEAAQAVMKKAVELAPDSWIPGGKPDPLINHKHGLIGAPVSRIDGPLKVAGQARFAAEFAPDGMVYAAVLYSTIPKGRISKLDTSAADSAPGVVLVMTHRNAPKMGAPAVFFAKPKGAAGDPRPVMQDDRVYWNGDPVAVVLAETQEQADYAKSLIEVGYATEPALTDFEAAKPNRHTPDNLVGQPAEHKVGDAKAALAASSHRVDETYRTPQYNHNPIELHAVTLFWEGDQLTVHDATQAVTFSAFTIGDVFGLKEEQVHVSSPYVGGGFGCKTTWHHHFLAAAAARLADRPVRLMLSREGVYRLVGGRATTEQRVAIGADADGSFDAIIHTGDAAAIAAGTFCEPFIFPTKCLYDAKAFDLRVDAVDLDMLANTFMRAPGESVGTFALESAVDELADRLGIDPIELRLRNEPSEDPIEGTPFSARNLAEAYRRGTERFGWSERQAEPGQRREGDWLIGMGVASATYPYQRMPGGAARITLTRDGRATIAIGAHEMGMGTATAQSQVAAERLGLDLDRITFDYGDSTLPGDLLAGGSQQTACIGAAVIAAHRKLVGELLKLAGNDSSLAGLKPEEVGGLDGGLCKLDEPGRCESYASILGRAQRDEVSVEAEAPPPLELQHWSMHSYGAQFCEVRVNAVTGEPRVSRFLGSFDCGRILNAKTAASQFRGGIIMGLGLALTEETYFDPRTGRVANPSLAEYHVPVQLDVPAIDIMWTDIPDPHSPMGARGIGEIGITGVGAAVANAVYNACGVRVRDLPITLDKLLAGMNA